jgi:hypothetical protein
MLFSGKKQNLQIIRHWITGILPHVLPQFMKSVATMQQGCNWMRGCTGKLVLFNRIQYNMITRKMQILTNFQS